MTVTDNTSKMFNELSRLARFVEAWQTNLQDQLSPADHQAYQAVKGDRAPELSAEEQCYVLKSFLRHADRKIGIMDATLDHSKLKRAVPSTMRQDVHLTELAGKYDYPNIQKLCDPVFHPA